MSNIKDLHEIKKNSLKELKKINSDLSSLSSDEKYPDNDNIEFKNKIFKSIKMIELELKEKNKYLNSKINALSIQVDILTEDIIYLNNILKYNRKQEIIEKD